MPKKGEAGSESRYLALFRRLVLGCALGLLPASLAAQARAVPWPDHPLSVLARRDLRFGSVFRGRSTTVAPRDQRAAMFEVAIGHEADLLFNFLLPAGLVSPTGDALPLTFGPADGMLVRQHTHSGGGTRFDPTRPFTATVSDGERLFLHLGGTAAPTPVQPLASYHGTITLVVAALGT
jgi:hypothetical protein